MVDHHHQQQQQHQIPICCMCGDVGFPEKLFACERCRFRHQHSYCTSYPSDSTAPHTCDWCLSDAARAACSSPSAGQRFRSEYSGERIKLSPTRAPARSQGGVPSPRHTTRRYKLLKDVMC